MPNRAARISSSRPWRKSSSPTSIKSPVELKAHGANRKILGFAPLIDTARKASLACQKVGLRSDYVYGEDPERDKKRQRFADWDLDIMWNAMLWTEGFDDPSIDGICILRPTKNKSLILQMLGRGMRLDPPLKQNMVAFDFLWQYGKYKPCRPAHLIARSEEEADAITELAVERSSALPADIAVNCELDLQVLSTSATAKREEALRKKLEENKNKKGKYISAEEFALQHRNMEVAEFEPVVAWHRLPVTEPQEKALKRAKIDPESVRGRGHASALLGLHFSTQKITLASLGQRTKMRQLGHQNWEQATQFEARQFFKELRAA
jgi:superfamily II DNA or RNA helicase